LHVSSIRPTIRLVALGATDSKAMPDSAVKDFSLPSTGGGIFQLSRTKARFLVLYFYPKDNTPGCTTEGLQFAELHREFGKAGAEVYGI